MDVKGNKNPVNTGLYGPSWITLDFSLVEAAGVEPASAVLCLWLYMLSFR